MMVRWSYAVPGVVDLYCAAEGCSRFLAGMRWPAALAEPVLAAPCCTGMRSESASD